jgi:hypothetical protein
MLLTQACAAKRATMLTERFDLLNVDWRFSQFAHTRG